MKNDAKKERQVITVTGKTGRGKTFLIMNYLAKMAAKKQPVLIADSMNEYQGGKTFENMLSFLDHVKAEGFSGVNIVRLKSDLEALKCFAFSRFSAVKHLLIVEEASKYCSPHTIDENLKALVSYGRHWGVSLVFCAQRFAQLNKIITSQSDFFISFQQTEQNDLKQISNFLNTYEKIRELEKREFMTFGDVPENSEFKASTVQTLKNSKIVTA